MIEKLKQHHFIWFQGPMLAWAAALFMQSSIPGDRIPDLGIFTHDKLIHFSIYVVFAAVVQRAVRNQNRFPLAAKHRYAVTFLVVAIFGASDEFHQYFVSNRSCSVLDWLADSCGAVAYLSYVWLKAKSKPDTIPE